MSVRLGPFAGTLTVQLRLGYPGAPFNLTFDTIPPAAPTGLTALGANMMASLDWADNSDSDLAGYNVYRGTTSGVYAKINTSLVTASAYSDSGLTNGTEYYYVVRAVDTSGNESTNSNEGYAIPTTQLGSALQFTSPNTMSLSATLPNLIWPHLRSRPGSIAPVQEFSTTGTSGIRKCIPRVSAHGAPEAEGSSVGCELGFGN